MTTNNTISRWLIVRNGAVGDTILLSPLIQLIRTHHPFAWVEVMGNQERVEMLVGKGLADQAKSFEQTGIETLFSDAPELHPSLQKFFHTYDFILYFGQSGLKKIFRKLQQRVEQTVLVHLAIPERDDIHITHHYCNVISGIIDTDEVPIPKIMLTEQERDWGKKWMKLYCENIEKKHQLFGLHVGAGSKEKQAPYDVFHKAVTQQGNPYLLITKGPADEDAVASFISEIPTNIPYAVIEKLTLRKLACVLSHCEAFIGNDSGITHLAAALGIPTTAIFVASNPNVWAPVGEHVWIVSGQ